MKSEIESVIKKLFPEVNFEVTIPTKKEFGDYSTNLAFGLAKKSGRNLNETLKTLKETLGPELDYRIDKVETVNGYVNFFLKKDYLYEQFKKFYADEKHLKQTRVDINEKIVIEYSSPNIAKPMHIGHLRSTTIGDAIANIYEYLGYDVVRWNYLGDWGTQFGKLIAAYKKWGDEKKLKKNPVEYMAKLYVKFHEETKSSPELEKTGQEEFSKLENGDMENKKLWSKLRNLSVDEFNKIYKKLEINQSKVVIKGESDYQSNLENLIKDLVHKRLAKKSEGALIVELPDLPPALLKKSDGATLYLTRELATLKDRIENYGANKILYVVANQQSLHFQQLFAIAKLLDWNKTELIHVKFGMVLGEDGKKLSTREGKVVLLEEVINKAEKMALEVVYKKNPDLNQDEFKEIAHQVAIGALKYNDLKQHPYSDIIFEWGKMLNLKGDNGPYLQYTHARLNQILEKGGFGDTENPELLDKEEMYLIKTVLDFKDSILQCVKMNSANPLALYLYRLSSQINQYYEATHILSDEDQKRLKTRLALIKILQNTVKTGLELLGIKALEKI